MLTITKSQSVQPSGVVAAACPPVLLEREWAVAPKPLAQAQVQGSTREFGGLHYAGTFLIAQPVAGIAGNSGADLHRPFTTMSRRDPRTWRPPH